MEVRPVSVIFLVSTSLIQEEKNSCDTAGSVVTQTFPEVEKAASLSQPAARGQTGFDFLGTHSAQDPTLDSHEALAVRT